MNSATAHAQRQVRVRSHASGIPTPENFELVDGPLPACPAGGVLLRVLLAAVDPAMRGWLNTAGNYMSVQPGSVMRAHGVGEVIATDCADWQLGELAFGWLGWQRYAAVAPAELLWRIEPGIAPLPAWLNIFGLNGLAAWVGFSHLARPLAGQTVLVTTAAGGVGAAVGQLAAALGLAAVGVTGGPEKVALATAEFGYATALDYRAAGEGLAAEIRAACPKGIDVFFDNTAGQIADAVFPSLNVGARVIQCGTASIANWSPAPSGPRRERDVLVKRLSWQGFVVFDHTALFPTALAELQALYKAGGLRSRDEILEGLEAAPGAIERLYSGANLGRVTIRP